MDFPKAGVEGNAAASGSHEADLRPPPWSDWEPEVEEDWEGVSRPNSAPNQGTQLLEQAAQVSAIQSRLPV